MGAPTGRSGHEFDLGVGAPTGRSGHELRSRGDDGRPRATISGVEAEGGCGGEIALGIVALGIYLGGKQGINWLLDIPMKLLGEE